MGRLLAVLLLAPLGVLFATTALADAIRPRPFVVPARLPDVAETLSPGAAYIDGWLGPRLLANEKDRLLAVDTEPLLAGFRFADAGAEGGECRV